MNVPQDFPPRHGPPLSEGNNPFRDNPYAAPGDGLLTDTGYQPPDMGKVHHVRVVAILMVIQGILEGLMALLLIGFAVGFPMLLAMEEMEPNADAPPEEMAWVFIAIYGGLGAMTLAAAVLHIVAGIRNYLYRGRLLGLVALAGGMATMFTCYCAPTAVGLAVYGLIVYLDPAVMNLFARVQAEGQQQEDEAMVVDAE
jgi:hypothetical protein